MVVINIVFLLKVKDILLSLRANRFHILIAETLYSCDDLTFPKLFETINAYYKCFYKTEPYNMKTNS